MIVYGNFIKYPQCASGALAKYQDESGLWHTLINDSNSYLESSATAGFAYGILKAVHKNIFLLNMKKWQTKQLLAY